MAEVLLFHHAQGLTAGCRALADDLRAGGHVVHAPDLYDGRTFATLADGVAHAQELGFGTVIDRGRRAADGLPSELVYVGLSLGVLPAQALAQTRPGARGAVLLHGCVDPADLDAPWPDGLPLQIHLMDRDEETSAPGGDLDVARRLDAALPTAELFVYPGDRHLFSDRSLPAHDEAAATAALRRVLALLDALE